MPAMEEYLMYLEHWGRCEERRAEDGEKSDMEQGEGWGLLISTCSHSSEHYPARIWEGLLATPLYDPE